MQESRRAATTVIEMVKRSFVLAASVLALVSACGSTRPDYVSAPVAERLAAQSDAVAARLRAGDGCGAVALARQLRHDVAAAGLPAGAWALAAGLASEIVCVPPAPPAAAAPVVTQPLPDKPNEYGQERPKGHEKHKHGKGAD